MNSPARQSISVLRTIYQHLSLRVHLSTQILVINENIEAFGEQ